MARTGALLALALLVAVGAPIAAGRAQTDGTTTITMIVHGIRTDTGRVRGGVYDRSEVWTQYGGQVDSCTARVSHGVARCVLHVSGPGRYAFAFYHDADDDSAMDTDALGIPQEGYGFSNDVRPGLGPPSFESAAFSVTGASYEARVVTRYGWSP